MTAGPWSTSTPGATSQKPTVVLDAEREFYELHNAAVHRGAHQLAEEATDAFEAARAAVAGFIGADAGRGGVHQERHRGHQPGRVRDEQRGHGWRRRPRGSGVGPGDEIVVTEMEHHANLVPWQELCRRTGATLRWLEITDEGTLDLSGLATVVNERTQVLAFAHVSNVLGTLNPVAPLVARAREVGALVVLDACQSVPHLAVDVRGARGGLPGLLRPQDARSQRRRRPVGPARAARRHAALPDRWLDDRDGADGGLDLRAAAAAVRGRRADGRAGRRAARGGRLPQRARAWIALPPRSIRSPTRCWTAWPSGRGCGCSGRPTAASGPAPWRSSSTAYTPTTSGQVLDDAGVAVRVGHHCAWPLHRRFGVAASTRASFGPYNGVDDVEALLDGAGPGAGAVRAGGLSGPLRRADPGPRQDSAPRRSARAVRRRGRSR